MSANSKIEWCDHTFNPWIGCTRVSPGCDNCYAAVSTPARTRKIEWGAGEPRQRMTSTWKDPKAWNDGHERFFALHGRRQRVFCASLADVFDNAVPVQWRMDLFQLIAETPNLDWLVLTKRIGNVMPMCSGDGLMFEMIASRVWLGATVVNQEEADRDIPKLLAVPAAKRFLSMEPLLGPVDLRYLQPGDPPTEINALAGTHGVLRPHRGECEKVDWVIVGGESGPGARPMHPDWARSLRDQCQEAGVPFHFKQWGEWAPRDEWSFHNIERQCAIKLDGSPVSHDDAPQDVGGWRFMRVGKKTAGRRLDGVEHNGFPGGAS